LPRELSFKSKCAACRTCPYYDRPFVPPEIRPDAEGLLVGESPWKTEVEQQLPFVGPAGNTLEELLTASGLRRADFSVTNAVLCQPHLVPSGSRGDFKIEEIPNAVIRLCHDTFLQPLVERLKPNLVVPMGDVAVNAITKRRGITRQRGLLFQHKFGSFTTKVLPTFHPAYIMRSPQMMPLTVSDLRQAAEQLAFADVMDYAKTVDYQSLGTKAAALAWFDALDQADEIAIDCETTGLNYLTDDVLCISFASQERKARVLDFFTLYPDRVDWAYDPTVLTRLYELLHSGKIIYGQNFKFDLRFLRQVFLKWLAKDLDIQKIRWREVLLMQHLLDETQPKDLKSMAHMYTDIRYQKTELDIVRAGLIKKADVQARMRYAAKDADATLRIGRRLVRRLKAEHDGKWWKLYVSNEMPMSKWLFESELFGIHASRRRIGELKQVVKAKLRVLRTKMYELAGGKFNIRSTKQLPKVMFETLRIEGNPNYKTTTGKLSTGKEHIQWLLDHRPHPFLSLLRLYREYDKLYSTFVRGLSAAIDANGLLHPDFLVWGTVTGRISSRNPNVLNIPRDRELSDQTIISVRKVFTARKGHQLLVADYSQIELKIIAIMANVTSIIEQLREGQDFHTITAREMYGVKMKKAEAIATTGRWKDTRYSEADRQVWTHRMDTMRSASKTFNFAMVFQAGNDKLAEQLKTTVEKAEEFRDTFFLKYPQILEMMESCKSLAWYDGKVELPNGRMRRFPKVFNQEQRGEQGRQAFNVLPQGMAGYVGRSAFIRIAKRFREESIRGFLTNTVYDSIMAEVESLDVNRAGRIMAEEMLRPVALLNNFSFSIKLGVGRDWAEAEQQAYKVLAVGDLKEWSEVR
jgi:DNA polymerase-1